MYYMEYTAQPKHHVSAVITEEGDEMLVLYDTEDDRILSGTGEVLDMQEILDLGWIVLS